MTGRPPVGVRAALLGRRLGVAAICCAVVSTLGPFFVDAWGLVIVWVATLLLGVVGVIASLVGLTSFSTARWNVMLGFTMSVIAVGGPLLFWVWALRNAEWGW